MNDTPHTCRAIAALLFVLVAQESNGFQLPNSKSSPQPPTSSLAAQQISSPKAATSVPGENASTGEPKESFSQLTLFLFASGLGLFIALLGWSDQIRGIDKDTRDLEERFLKKTKINKGNFVEIVKPESPDDQLVALTQAVSDGKLTSMVSVKVLHAFADYIVKWSSLERLSNWKYNITVTLTFALFVSGTASLFTTPTQRLQVLIAVRIELILLLLPMTLIGLLLFIIVCSARKEKELRSLLNSMSDMV